MPVTARDRLRALIELRDSGPGRPLQTSEFQGYEHVPAFVIDCAPFVGDPRHRPGRMPSDSDTEDVPTK